MLMIRIIFYIAIGGALGSVCRFLLPKLLFGTSAGVFPWGTWLVNVVGCLLIGFLSTWLSGKVSLSAVLMPLLVTGFCGGFTTFSTFSNETLSLVRASHSAVALLYQLSSIVVGFLAAYAGSLLARLF